MKKIALIIMFALYASMTAFGQDSKIKTTKSFIGLNGGYALAIGNFTKNDYNDNKSGYANSSGSNIGLEGAYYLNKTIGIGGVFSNTSFYCKGLQTMSDGYKEDFDVDSSTVTITGKYSTFNFLIGPYFTFPVGKFAFEARVAAGLVRAKTPQFKVDLEDQSAVAFYQNSATANTFGFQAGAGIRYSIIEHLCIKLAADFFYSQPDFKIENQNRVVNAGRLVSEYKQPIMGVYLNLGIAYQFGK